MFDPGPWLTYSLSYCQFMFQTLQQLVRMVLHLGCKGQRAVLGVGVGAEVAEYDDLEEANIGKMDNLFETESETSDKEAENYKCAICQKVYIDNTELCDVEENKESEEDRENVSCPYCQKLFSNSKEVLKHMEVH